jgi:uncharacterized membrane protein
MRRVCLPLPRVLFALAGTMAVVSVVLATTVSTWFLVLAAFVAANQWLYAAVGACPTSLVLQRLPRIARETRS